MSCCCSVCLNPFNEREELCPRVLPCGHTFCSSCLHQIISRSQSQSSSHFPCPHCQRATKIETETNIEIFPKNYIVLQELSSMSSLASVVVMCSDHSDKPVEFHDVNCERAICSYCLAFGNHTGKPKFTSFLTLQAPGHTCLPLSHPAVALMKNLNDELSNLIETTSHLETTDKICLLAAQFEDKRLEIDELSLIAYEVDIYQVYSNLSDGFLIITHSMLTPRLTTTISKE